MPWSAANGLYLHRRLAVDAQVHEVKDYSVATFDRQLAETRALLGTRLDLYQIHSVTPDSTALTDAVLHHRLAGLAAEGVTIGLSTSGPGQGATIRAALDLRVGRRAAVRQRTGHLERPRTVGGRPSPRRAAGYVVIVKEALANGRLTGRESGPVTAALTGIADELATTPDAVCSARSCTSPGRPLSCPEPPPARTARRQHAGHRPHPGDRGAGSAHRAH